MNTESTEGDGKDAPPPLDAEDIELLKAYGHGPYTALIKAAEADIKSYQDTVKSLIGIKESDTGLSQPSQWDLVGDKQMMQEEHPLQVARCTKIIPGETPADTAKYVINVRQIAKFVVGLGEKVAPTDVEEGMRVGVDRTKYSIQLPLPPKIDPTVSLMTVEDKPDVTYDDVGGAKDAIEKLREVVETPLLHPERFVTLGIDPPKGVLLYGPPGTGKTLSARAVANRTDACFIRVIGSELVQKYVGEGARMVRELFNMARSKKACIVFFDEIDAIGGTRGGEDGSDNEVQRTMLQIVTELDGFDARGNIKVRRTQRAERRELCARPMGRAVLPSRSCSARQAVRFLRLALSLSHTHTPLFTPHEWGLCSHVCMPGADGHEPPRHAGPRPLAPRSPGQEGRVLAP